MITGEQSYSDANEKININIKTKILRILAMMFHSTHRNGRNLYENKINKEKMIGENLFEENSAFKRSII